MNKIILTLLVIFSTLVAQKIDTAALFKEYQKNQVDSNSIEFLREQQILLRTNRLVVSDSLDSVMVDSIRKHNNFSELDNEKVYRTSLQDTLLDSIPLEIFGHAFLQNLLFETHDTVVVSKNKKTGKMVKDTQEVYTPKPTTSSTFSAVNSGYRMGPGDQVVISIWGDVQKSFTLPIDGSGAINVPTVGQIVVAGLTLAETKKILIQKFTKVFSGVRNGRSNATTFVDVSMGRIRQKSVVVVGFVRNPGTHSISSTGGIVAALAAAGGPTDKGSVRNILVQHGGNRTDTVDLYNYLLSGTLSDSSNIADYDVIVVPAATKRVALQGAVINPAYYDLKDGETCNDLIAFAGGFSPEAYTPAISLTRTLPGNVRTPSAFKYAEDSAKELIAQDSLFVPFLYQEANEIVVEGSVKQPGSFGYYNGITLYDAIIMAGGVADDYFPDRLEVLRTHKDLKKEIFSVNLDKLMASHGAEANLALSPRDVIKVYSIWDLDTREYVVIRGEVAQPGKYFLRKGMSVEDLILLAGGITEYAYRDSIEISRIVAEDKSSGNTTESRKVATTIDFFKKNTFPLQHKDNVFIKTNSSYKDQAVVVLKGEFSYPGPYAKLTEDETLLSLIKRAGGIKESGYLEGAIFIRGKDSIGVVSIDVKKLLKKERSRDDIVLEDRDTLYIPTVPKTVIVKGSVNYPTAVKYVPGKNVGYYLKRAGGYQENADKHGKYSILANGAVKSVRKCSKHVNAGTQIIVPQKPDNSERRAQNIALTAAIVGIFSSLALIAVSISNIVD